MIQKNRELNEQEIKAGKLVLESKPRRMIVTLSTRCNARCIMCEVRHNSWDIPARTIHEIVALFPTLESIAWQGGEVFYLDFFPELFAEALKYPAMKQTIVSNGLLLTEAWAEKIVAANMELALSIDGVTKEVYEKIRAGSKYEVLFRNIRMLNEVRKRSRSRLSLRMHTVVMRSNYRQMEDFVALAKDNGFDALHMMPIWGGQEIDENIFLPGNEEVLEQVQLNLGRVEQRAREKGIEFLNSLPVKSGPVEGSGTPSGEQHPAGEPSAKEAPAKALLCSLPWQQLDVDPGGGVRPGCLCSRSIGSVAEKSLLELWNGEGMRHYREKVLAGGSGWCNAHCISGAMPEELRRV
ncbi:MAG: radical SAM protein [Endomicrobiales bacterium]